jgi:hypothetical protein
MVRWRGWTGSHAHEVGETAAQGEGECQMEGPCENDARDAGLGRLWRWAVVT